MNFSQQKSCKLKLNVLKNEQSKFGLRFGLPLVPCTRRVIKFTILHLQSSLQNRALERTTIPHLRYKMDNENYDLRQRSAYR